MDGGSWHCTGDHPQEKEMQKAKWLSGEALQIAEKRREVKGKGEKETHKHLNAEFQRIARRDKKAFLSGQCKEIEENNRMEKTRDLCMKCSLGISDFLEEISSLSHHYCFPLFLCTDHWGRLSHLSLLFFGILQNSKGNIYPFLLCFSLLFTAICKASSASLTIYKSSFYGASVSLKIKCS